MLTFSQEAERDLDRLILHHPQLLEDMINCFDEIRTLLLQDPLHPMSEGYHNSIELRKMTGIEHRALTVVYRYFPAANEVFILGVLPNW